MPKSNNFTKRKSHFIVKILVLGICLVVWLPGLNVSGAGNIPGAWLKISDNGRLALWVDTGYGLCRVVDHRNGQTWDSLPVLNQKPDQYWTNAFHSAFIIQYATDYNSIETAFSGGPNCERDFSTSPEGCAFSFKFRDLQVSFTAYYSLGSDNNLRVNIPLKSLSDPKKRLLDIRFLPYFGGLPYQSNGYAVLPDGCGGIVTPNHLTAPYKATRIYGQRFQWSSQPVGSRYFMRILNLSDYSSPQNSFYNLPLFGIVKTNAGILSVISQGQFQAEVGTQITAHNFLLTVSPRLIIREANYDMYGRLHASPIFYQGDRIVDYYFLADRNGISYVDIATKYREIILKKKRRQYKTNLYLKSKQRDTGYRLRLLMGVAEQYQDTEKLLTLTSFSQAEGVLNHLYKMGVRDLQVVLVGWTSRGVLGDNPRHFPPDGRFGGMKGLRRLLATGKKLGYFMGLEFNNTYAFKKSHGFNRNDTVKDMQEIPIDIGYGSKEYLLCQQVGWSKFIRNELPKLKKLEITGHLIFDGLNQGFIPCYDSRHPVSGANSPRILSDSIRELSKFLKVGVTVAEDYLAGEVSAIYNLPAGCSENCDRAVPLTPIIFHGIVPYSFEPVNLRRDGQREFLRMVEYGGVPNAFLTAKRVSELVYAKYNPLFSGNYADWSSVVFDEYKIYQKDLRRLQMQAITDHQRLDKDVYLTVYEDGSQVIVNYSRSHFIFNKFQVGPENYLVIRNNSYPK